MNGLPQPGLAALVLLPLAGCGLCWVLRAPKRILAVTWLASLLSALAAAPGNALLIEGHCDERGTEEYNRALGERRADGLREALVKQGVSADRIATRSFGKDKPVDPGHNEAAFSKNRRGEFILLHPKTGV